MQRDSNKNFIGIEECLYMKHKIVYFINVLVFGLAYGMYLAPHYSLDSYSVYFYMDPDIHLKQSRFLNYLIMKLFQKTNINTVKYQSIFTLLMIITFSFVTVKLTYLIFEYFNQKSIMQFIILNVVVAISFINVFILEWFLYPEIALFYSLSIISILLGIVCFLKSDRWINSALAFVLLCISLNFYQAAMPIFVIYLLTIGMLRYKMKFSKKSLVYNIKVLGIAFLSCVNTLMLQRLAILFKITEGGDRDASLSISTILHNAVEIIKLQKRIWYSTYDFLPRYTAIIVVLLLLLIFGITVAKEFGIKNWCYFILVFLISYGLIFAPHLITESLWFAQRTIVAYFSIFMIIVCGTIYNRQKLNRDRLILGILTLFLFLNIYAIQSIGANHYSSNKLDQNYAVMIQDQIERYEQETGNIITKIACIVDPYPVYSYPGIKYTIFDTNVRGFVLPWADVNMINFYNGKNYEKVVMDEEIYNQYFAGKDWNRFIPEEQMKFVGDTLNLMLY